MTDTSAELDLDALSSLNADVRLVAVDMDGTLLDEHGQVPRGLWPLLEEMSSRGILFVPASGRQYATLRREFGAHGDDLVFIAENGTFVSQHERELSSAPMSAEVVSDLAQTIRGFSHDVGVVMCGKRSAYVERTDRAFRSQAEKYYAELADVSDVADVEDDILKVAVYDFTNAEQASAPALERFRETHQVVVSNHHWVDVMNQGVSKGHALQGVQQEFDVAPEQTVVFGDYLNDLDMMDVAHYSFAMANAHPTVAERARFRAPSNRDHGVVSVLERLLG